MSYNKISDVTGKTKEILDSNKDFNFKERFGCIPKSIMKFKKSEELMKLIDYDNSEIGKVEGEAKARGGGYASTLRYSIYNPDQAYFILDYYTNENYLILDPFCGRVTRPIVCLHLNRKYIGFDTSHKTIELNKEIINKKFDSNYIDNKIKLIHGDGTKLNLFFNKSEVIDAVFTCPPYYDIEKYSNEPGDLSYLKYNEYDLRIKDMFTQLYSLIKKSSYEKMEFHPVIITVGSIRKGQSGLIDMDLIFQNIAKECGFVLHDKLFTENNTPGAGFTFRRNYSYKYLTKNYETTLVFLKY